MEALAYILIGGLLVGGGVVLGRWTLASGSAPVAPVTVTRTARQRPPAQPQQQASREPRAISDEAQWIEEELEGDRKDVW